MCTECDVSSTYPKLLLHPFRLVVEYPAVPIFGTRGGGIVVERVSRPRHSGILNQTRVVFPAQKTENAIDVACVISLHNNPAPAQVIKRNY
jgi:hypothetical protein